MWILLVCVLLAPQTSLVQPLKTAASSRLVRTTNPVTSKHLRKPNNLATEQVVDRGDEPIQDLIVLRASYHAVPRQRRTKFVLVVGLESSGSKLAARLLAMRFGPEKDGVSWSGHTQFVTVQPPLQAIDKRLWRPTGTVVVHRSVPQWKFFPDIESALAQAFCDGFQEVYLVVSTREKHISLRSKLGKHQSDTRLALGEQATASSYLRSVIERKMFPTFVFSYESLMLLGPGYVRELYGFVGETVEEPILGERSMGEVPNFDTVEAVGAANATPIHRPTGISIAPNGRDTEAQEEASGISTSSVDGEHDPPASRLGSPKPGSGEAVKLVLSNDAVAGSSPDEMDPLVVTGTKRGEDTRGREGSQLAEDVMEFEALGRSIYDRQPEVMCKRVERVVASVREARGRGIHGAATRLVLGWDAQVGQGTVDPCVLVKESNDPNAAYTGVQTWFEWIWQQLHWVTAKRDDALETITETRHRIREGWCKLTQ